MKVAIVSLGCNKNLVDSEVMAGYLEREGLLLTENREEAEVIIVNTCGFIEDAKQEAVDTIFQMAAYKKKNCRALLATGCLAQRYPEALRDIEELDGLLGTYGYAGIVQSIRDALDGKRPWNTGGDARYLDNTPRRVSTKYYAYLKIAEGCDNRCAYCAIPGIRGPYVSRSFDSLLAEARRLKKQGVRELILTAQDTTRYGLDRGTPEFARLLEEIAALGFDWVRIMYAYPSTLGEDVLDVMEKHDNICKYVDLPIQHTQDRMLRLMNRHYTRADVTAILERMRASDADWSIRTTLMCGFPGETNRDFRGMLAYIQQHPFDNLGVFPFSSEEGTEAEKMPHPCRKSTAEARADSVMLLQGEIANRQNARRVGKTYRTLTEGYDEEQKLWWGRTYFLAPEVDGLVYFSGDAVPGEFCNVTIDEAFGYDFFGRVTT